LIALPLALAFAYAYGLLTAVMPRSGADYVLVTRILNPFLGIFSSVTYAAANCLGIAAAALGFSTLALAPALTVIGLTTGSHTFTNWGSTVSSSNGWKFAIGTVIILVGCATLCGSWRLTRRILFTMFWISMAGLGFTLAVALVTSHADFVKGFNTFARQHAGLTNAYQSIIASARRTGTPVDAHFSLANTIPMVGVLGGFAIYSWFSSFLGAEIRQGSSTKTAHRNAIGAVLTLGTLALATIILYHSVGRPFLTAAFGSPGMPAALGSTPTYFFLTSAQLGSPVIAIVLSVAFLFVLLTQIPNIALAISRALFAWGFDGLLPKAATKVTSRGSPIIAVAITAVVTLGVYAWAIFIAASFVQVVVYGALFAFFAMGLVGVSAVVLPYRFKKLYQASSSNVRVLGIPALVWAGIASILSIGFFLYLYFHFPYFGLGDKVQLLAWFGGTAAVAASLYWGARVIRQRQGIDLRLTYKEIPPE
jgi:amino acid transporter